MFWKLIKSLRPAAIAVAVVAWNAICLVGIWLNGGLGRIETVGSAIAMVVACGLLSVTCFLVASTSYWQQIALRPGTDPREPRAALWFLGILGALLAIGGTLSALFSASAA